MGFWFGGVEELRLDECVTESSLLLASLVFWLLLLLRRSNSTRAFVFFGFSRMNYYSFARNDASVNTCVVDFFFWFRFGLIKCVCYIKQNILCR